MVAGFRCHKHECGMEDKGGMATCPQCRRETWVAVGICLTLFSALIAVLVMGVVLFK